MRGTKLSIFQVIDFPFSVNRGVSPFFHSCEYPRFEQSSWSDRTAGVSSNNCTVTNRSRSWTKTVAHSFICTFPVAVSRLWRFGPSQIIHCIWAYVSLAQHCALKLPNPQQTYDLLCLWRLHRRLKRSLIFFSRQFPRHFAGTICLSWSFLRCLFLQTLMTFTLLDNASRLPFSFLGF